MVSPSRVAEEQGTTQVREREGKRERKIKIWSYGVMGAPTCLPTRGQHCYTPMHKHLQILNNAIHSKPGISIRHNPTQAHTYTHKAHTFDSQLVYFPPRIYLFLFQP